MKNMRDIMKQAQKMQANMAKVQEELVNETVEASSGGGAVKVIASGNLEIREIRINPEAVDPDDVPFIEEMVLVAVNDALRQAQDLASRRMQDAAGPLGGMGGMGGLGF